jgi:hypothetical protein
MSASRVARFTIASRTGNGPTRGRVARARAGAQRETVSTLPSPARAPALDPVQHAAALPMVGDRWPEPASDAASDGPASDGPGPACANCGTPAPLAYCPACGQAQHAPHRSLASIADDLADTFLGWHGRIPVTLWLLVRYPGRLTAEYVAGRRVRYLPPLRLYLTMGALLFLAFKAAAPRMNGLTVTVGPGVMTPSAPAAQPKASARPSIVGTTGAWQKLKRSYFGDRLRTLNGMPRAEQQRELRRAFLARLGTTFFVLIPVFALLVSALYRRGPLVYAEHLVFVLHGQAFAAGVLALALAVGGAAGALTLLVALPPYAFVALRRVYGGSRRRTLAKLVLLGAGYLVVLSVAMLVTVLAAFLLG